jgi:hypothetical protein
MRSLKTRLGIATIALVAGATVAAGVAFATIPDSAGTQITACSPKAGPGKGALRVIDAPKGAKCGAGEATITWSSRALTWHGQWKATAAYIGNDVVGYQGAAYVAAKPNKFVRPTVKGAWALLAPGALKGAPGSTQHCIAYPHQHSDFSRPGSTPGHGCSLLGADLTGFNLRGSNFTNADLTRVNMTGALLFGDTFTGAIITGIKWSHTECPDATLSDANGTSPQSCAGHLVHFGPGVGPKG